MKKNVIALMIAMVLAAGSITTAPVMAAETISEMAVEEVVSSNEETAEDIEETDVETDGTAEDVSEGTFVEEVEESENDSIEEAEMAEDYSGEDGDYEILDSSAYMGENEEPEAVVEEQTENGGKDAAIAEAYEVNDLTWTVAGVKPDLTATISGNGKITSFPSEIDKSQIKTIIIEDGVTSVGKNAFYRCSNLASITIPDSVTSIEENAFYQCSHLTSITIPDSVTSIGGSAFYECSSLTNITIPDSVTSIEPAAFYKCIRLASITIPDSVTSIGGSAFYHCSSLTNITIPDSVTSIGRSAFYECRYLASITIPDSVTSIGEEAFYECRGLTSITIPDSVTSIGEGAFYGCSSLTSITIPDSVTNIENESFKFCSSLTSITIPDSVTSIGEGAFYGCSSLTKITIPDSVTTIGTNAFGECNSLTSISIGDNVKKIGLSAFFGCNSLTSITIPDSVTSIGAYAFSECSGLTSITIPDSVTKIEGSAFNKCSSLASITIPDSVTSIGAYAFSECSVLTSITIPDSVTKIEEGAFNKCSSLASMTIPDSVTNIGTYAFSECRSLTSITIPENVTYIGGHTFNGCSGLKVIYFKGIAPSTSFDKNICKGVSATAYYPYDDATWTEDIKQNYGGEITWIPYNPETLGEIDLDPEITCSVDDRIQISATYTGESELTSASVSSDAGDALEFSEVSIMGPVDNGDGKETIISFTVTGKETGEYNLILIASDGASASTVLKVVGEYDIANAEVLLLGKTYIDEEGTYCFNYTGKPIRPVYTVKMSNKYVLEEDEDYTLTYEDNTELGTARCILEGIGDYYGEKIVEFLIVPVKPSFESVESEFPGSCTAVVNTLSKSMLYKIDVQKDGRSIDGYPQEVGDVSNPDGSSATNSFKEYVDHLEEGETYTIRVCAIAKIGGKSYQSEWNESEVKIAETSFKTKYPYILAAGEMSCDLTFTETEDLEAFFTGNGAIRVKDESGNDVFVMERLDGESLLSGEDNDCRASLIGGTVQIFLNTIEPNRACSQAAPNNKFLPGHHYYITIDPSAIRVRSNTDNREFDYSGSPENCKWTFETEELEVPSYINDGYVIPDQYITKLYAPDAVKKLKKAFKDNNPGQGGICYGFCAAVLAWNKGYPRLSSLKRSNGIDHLGNMPMEYNENPNVEDNTLFNYIVLQHMIQFSDNRMTIKNEHVNDIDAILGKVRAGEYFLIDLNAGRGDNQAGHTVIPLGYEEDDDGTVHLYCYNCEYSLTKPDHGFVDEVTIRRVNGKLSYWEWNNRLNAGIDHNAISWIDFDQSYDDLTQLQSGNLIYTNVSLKNNPKAVEIDGTWAASEVSEDQNGFEGYYYWYKDDVIEVSSDGDTPLNLSLSDGYKSYSGTVNNGTIFISLKDDIVRIMSDHEGKECSFVIQNWEDYDHSTKIGITAAGSDQTTLKQTDNGWYLEGSVPGTITITMEASGPDGDEEKTNTEEIVVESATGRVELIEDNYHNLNVFEDTDGDGSGDKKVGSMELPNVPGKPMTGKCGDNLTWTLGKDRVLRISGTGEMYNYTNKSPWSKYDFTSVVIENGVTGIGNYAFSQCTFLNSVSIPPSLKNIGRYAFLYPIGGKRIYITDLEAWLRINDDISSLHGEVFLNNKQLTEVTIPDGIEYFKRSAFDGCSKLKSVIIPEGVKRIPSSAFSGCTNLKSVEIPKSVLDIWSNAFSRCSSLTELSLPEGLMYISNDVFNGCKNLTSVKIPLSLTRIDEQAFSGCTALKDVYYAGKRSDWDKITVGRSNDYLLNADIHCAGDIVPPGKTTRGDMFNLANNVKVTWKEVPGAKYYKVYREGVTDKKETRKEPVIVTAGLVGWDKDPGLTNGHAYRYKIVASLTGKGDSSGDSTLSYSKLMYRLKTVVIRSVKNTAPGKVTVKYDKTTSGDSYVLQYSERQDMVGAKTKVVLGANNTSYTIGGLKKGKTYYISIRVRKKVNGIDYYTTFGVPKKITITK